MMTKVVIDTNVILTASGQHEGVSSECIANCSQKLLFVRNSCVVVIDDGYEILKEYQNKTMPSKGKAVGDVFLKWLLNNSANTKHCRQVSLTKGAKPDTYLDFPDQALQDEFDPPDRKFVAVAAVDGCDSKVMQAADCKWLNWNARLKAAGIDVEYICPDDICRFYSKKYPNQPVPDFDV